MVGHSEWVEKWCVAAGGVLPVGVPAVGGVLPAGVLPSIGMMIEPIIVGDVVLVSLCLVLSRSPMWDMMCGSEMY